MLSKIAAEEEDLFTEFYRAFIENSNFRVIHSDSILRCLDASSSEGYVQARVPTIVRLNTPADATLIVLGVLHFHRGSKPDNMPPATVHRHR